MYRRWKASAVPAVVVLCLLATACGGSSGASDDGVASAGGTGGASGAGASKETDPEKAGLNFARCMREHGVDMPDPKAGEGGMVVIGAGPGADAGATAPAFSGPPAGFEEAHKACRQYLEGLIGEGPGPMDPEAQDRALKFAQCMRDNGVDMPDPDFSGGGVRLGSTAGPGGPDFETFKAAQEKCGGAFGPGGLQAVTVSRS